MSEQPGQMDIGFRSAAERVKGERERRLQMASRVLSFGVKYLDLSLGGIFPHDLILIGARTGSGKTALASVIAKENAKKGKRVHFFALEAEPDEIERRIKYQLMAGSAYSRLGSRLCYLDWCTGKLDGSLRAFETEAEQEFERSYKTLHTFYRERNFTLDDLAHRILAVQDQTDLIIVDHLHYIDHDEPNENKAYKQVAQRLRDLAISTGKPVIIIAHLRKGDRKVKQVVPALDDFHGSSDVPKQATKAIMLASVDGKSAASHLWGTYIHPAKCRMDGSRARYVGRVTFNARKQAYEGLFEIGYLAKGGEEFEKLSGEDVPTWASPLQQEEMGP